MSAIAALVRLAATAVVTALVIGACAPRPEPNGEADAEPDVDAAPAERPDAGEPQEAFSAVADLPGDLRLTLALVEVAPSRPIEFTLELANGGADEAVVDFPDGQRFDLEVFDGETSVWRWASDLFFPMMLGRERIAPGESVEWSGRMEEGLPAGSYTVRGTLTTSARPTVEVAFTVDG